MLEGHVWRGHGGGQQRKAQVCGLQEDQRQPDSAEGYLMSTNRCMGCCSGAGGKPAHLKWHSLPGAAEKYCESSVSAQRLYNGCTGCLQCCLALTAVVISC